MRALRERRRRSDACERKRTVVKPPARSLRLLFASRAISFVPAPSSPNTMSAPNAFAAPPAVVLSAEQAKDALQQTMEILKKPENIAKMDVRARWTRPSDRSSIVVRRKASNASEAIARARSRRPRRFLRLTIPSSPLRTCCVLFSQAAKAAMAAQPDNIMMLMMLVLPVATEVCAPVFTKFGFPNDQGGLMAYMKAVMAHKDDAEIAALGKEMRATFVPEALAATVNMMLSGGM